MIYISCGLNQEFIIQLLENAKTKNNVTFKYEGKQGIKLAFAVNTKDLDNAVDEAKALIKGTEIGSIMYFQISK